jgi:peptide/nickel transport system permease protein
VSRYVAKRLLLAAPTVLGLTMLIFFTLRVLPGDVALTIVGDDANVSADRLEEIRRTLRLDQPIWVQYLEWLGQILRMDLGKSFGSDFPIATRLAMAFPVTFHLAAYTLVLTLLMAIPLGALSAVKRNSAVDYLCRCLALVGLSTPSFWVGIITLMVLAFSFNWMPQIRVVGFFENPLINFSQFIWPALVLATAQTAVLARLTRSALLEVLGEDYVRTARAKGLREKIVLFNHALRNALLPVVTLLGLQFAALLEGAVITETVFGLPGLGSTLIQGISAKDFPLIQASVLFIGLLVVGINLIVDLSYAWLDPRIKYE